MVFLNVPSIVETLTNENILTACLFVCSDLFTQYGLHARIGESKIRKYIQMLMALTFDESIAMVSS